MKLNSNYPCNCCRWESEPKENRKYWVQKV